MHFFHKWSKWQDYLPYGLGAIYRYQFKICSICNKRQERSV